MIRWSPSDQGSLRNTAVGTTSTVAQAFPTNSAGEVIGNSLLIANTGTQEAFIRIGTSSVSAATVPTASTPGSLVVPPGSDILITRPESATHFRAITAVGTTTLCVSVGHLL